MGGLSLRARLLAALAYVLVLAVAALVVPLVGSVRARVDAEVKTQALAQAGLVAASAVGLRRADLERLGDRVVVFDHQHAGHRMSVGRSAQALPNLGPRLTRACRRPPIMDRVVQPRTGVP